MIFQSYFLKFQGSRHIGISDALKLIRYSYFRHPCLWWILHYFILSLRNTVEYLNSLNSSKTSRHVISGRARDLRIVGIVVSVIFRDVDIRYVGRNVPCGDVFTRYSRLQRKKYVTILSVNNRQEHWLPSRYSPLPGYRQARSQRPPSRGGEKKYKEGRNSGKQI